MITDDDMITKPLGLMFHGGALNTKETARHTSLSTFDHNIDFHNSCQIY